MPLTFIININKLKTNRGNSLRRVKNGNKWRAREISLDQKPLASSNNGGSNSNSNVAINRLSANLTTADVSPALIAQANWTFVERLLKVRKLCFVCCCHCSGKTLLFFCKIQMK